MLRKQLTGISIQDWCYLVLLLLLASALAIGITCFTILDKGKAVVGGVFLFLFLLLLGFSVGSWLAAPQQALV
jgi:hypothetical protein